MSRLARNPINIPEDIKISLNDNTINFEGKLGKSMTTLPDGILIDMKDNLLHFTGENKALLGTVYANVKNEIIGNTKGFEKRLELIGTGYKANVSGKTLVLSLGYSHDINFKIPEGITIKVEKNIVSVTGTSKQLVGQVAAEIKSFRKPEPYKGKGVRYEGEKVYRKEGKKIMNKDKVRSDRRKSRIRKNFPMLKNINYWFLDLLNIFMHQFYLKKMIKHYVLILLLKLLNQRVKKN